MMTTHDRLLDAAHRCFYRQGINATGVEAVAAEAGVTKRTLYNHFPSKQELVVAYLRRRHERWVAILDAHLDGAEDIHAQLDAIVEAYVELPGGGPFRGCALINASAELLDEDPALAVIRTQLDAMAERLRDLLAQAGAADPGPLARQVLLVLEGMCGVGGIERSTAVVEQGKAAVHAVVAAQLPADRQDQPPAVRSTDLRPTHRR